jgi:hypothetical protein
MRKGTVVAALNPSRVEAQRSVRNPSHKGREVLGRWSACGFSIRLLRALEGHWLGPRPTGSRSRPPGGRSPRLGKRSRAAPL